MAKKFTLESWGEGEVLGVVFNGELLTGPLPSQFQTEPELGGDPWMNDLPPMSPVIGPAGTAKSKAARSMVTTEASHPARLRRPHGGG